MWSEGTIKIRNTERRYWVKHYDEPSEEYGIDGGRISKLMIKDNDNRITLNYDRGWDIEPEDEITQLAYAAIMKKFN
jgi:predicted secreted protein